MEWNYHFMVTMSFANCQRQNLVEVVSGKMMRNILSDLSGTSLSIAREKWWSFRGSRYQGMDLSASWDIEGVPWWRSLDCGHSSKLTRRLQDRGR
ncbi:hypothetical protein AVEN_269945-1 [Araneus ventricosus]|uniref:Uncharacterized protein n=1 Tax=Araneus ventricosus TaxID=182803 RepID=A0A4Y2RJC1_ARAVE|nr:hypothetical protein AVEN_269945-1 [Araneus ventricosus]